MKKIVFTICLVLVAAACGVFVSGCGKPLCAYPGSGLCRAVNDTPIEKELRKTKYEFMADESLPVELRNEVNSMIVLINSTVEKDGIFYLVENPEDPNHRRCIYEPCVLAYVKMDSTSKHAYALYGKPYEFMGVDGFDTFATYFDYENGSWVKKETIEHYQDKNMSRCGCQSFEGLRPPFECPFKDYYDKSKENQLAVDKILKKKSGSQKKIDKLLKKGFTKDARTIANSLQEPERTQELEKVFAKDLETEDKNMYEAKTGFRSAIETLNLLSEPRKTEGLHKIMDECLVLGISVMNTAIFTAENLNEPQRTQQLERVLAWLMNSRYASYPSYRPKIYAAVKAIGRELTPEEKRKVSCKSNCGK